MFDAIRKPEFFAWWDRGLCDKTHRTIKGFQDTWIASEVVGIKGLRILEIGGRTPRLLLSLAENNSCVNADAVLPDAPQPPNLDLTSIDTLLGDFDPRLEDNSFDLAFSISVLEHVPDEGLTDCFADMARVLKPGGRLLHAIDMYLGMTPDKVCTQRVDAYLEAASAAGLVLESPRALPAEPVFTTDMVSNPDNVMANWNTIAPTLRELREQRQGISYKCVWRKPADS